MQLQAFDRDYIDRLASGDARFTEHFVAYFTEFLQLKLRSRLRSPSAVEDVKQETLQRVLAAIRSKDGFRSPERLGPFVNTICNNVLLEHYRQARPRRFDFEELDGAPTAKEYDPSAEVMIRRVLDDLPEHDRALLRAVFLDERDRDEVAREFGVDRDYLRALLIRAKDVFKSAYLRRRGNTEPILNTEPS